MKGVIYMATIISICCIGIVIEIIRLKRAKKRYDEQMARRVMIQKAISETDSSIVQMLILKHGFTDAYEILLLKYKEDHGIED
jgi:hypothetical protein